MDYGRLGLLPINVVYRIYLECGHMINLFDWMQVGCLLLAGSPLRYLIRIAR